MNIQALSVVSPFGEWIAEGRKIIEVRSWAPAELPLLNVAIVQNDRRLLEDGDEDEKGFILAIVDFESVSPWSEDQLNDACANHFAEGYFGWHITNVRKLKHPIQTYAKRKIYELSSEDGCLLYHFSKSPDFG